MPFHLHPMPRVVPLLECATCRGKIHPSNSSYIEKDGKFYHKEKGRDCFNLKEKADVALNDN